MKATVHNLDFEFIALSGLVPSLVADAIFITGFLLSHVLADYKEAERMPGEIRLALEAIHDDVSAFSDTTPDVNIVTCDRSGIVADLETGLGATGNHSDLRQAIAWVDELSPVFAKLGRLGLCRSNTWFAYGANRTS